MRSTQFLLVTILVAITGCEKGKQDDTSSTNTTTNATTTTTTEAKHGLVGGGQTPSGWPSAVPIYPGATITSSAGTGAGKVVMLETPDAHEKVADWYKSNLGGWTKQSDITLATSNMLKFTSGRDHLSIIANKPTSGTGAHVTLSVDSK
jgi:hypothetical protein